MENELFEKAPVPRAYLKMALPIVFSMVISVIYNMVDTFFIAQTGDTNLVAGVSLCGPMFTMMIGLGDVFGLGGSSVISRLFGRQKYEDGRRLSVFCFYAAVLLGCVIAVLMLLFRRPMLGLLGANEYTVKYASQYYSVLALGAPFIILSFTPNNVLRTEGFSIISMYANLIGTAVNIILDPIFIFTFGMGAAGAAAATVLGYVCTIAFYVQFILRRPKYISINPKWLYNGAAQRKITGREASVSQKTGGLPAISMQEIMPILAIGIPAALTNLVQSFGTALLNRELLTYGNDKIAALGIASKIGSIAVLVLIGMAFGGQPLVGYNYGAKNYARLRKTMKFAYTLECSMAIVMCLTLRFAAPSLIRIFMQDPAIVEAGTEILRAQQTSMVAVAVVLVTTCTFQSTGKAMGALTLSVSRQGIVFAAVLAILSRTVGYHGVIVSQPTADFITAAMSIVIFYRTVYQEIRVKE